MELDLDPAGSAPGGFGAPPTSSSSSAVPSTTPPSSAALDLVARENQRWLATSKSVAMVCRVFNEMLGGEPFQAQLTKHILGYRTEAGDDGKYKEGDVLFAAYQDSSSEHWMPSIYTAVRIFDVLRPLFKKSFAAGEFTPYTTGRGVTTDRLRTFDVLRSPASPILNIPNLTSCNMAALRRLFQKEFHVKVEFLDRAPRAPIFEFCWDLSSGADSTLDYFIACVGMAEMGMTA